jgi:hypothetical protein
MNPDFPLERKLVIPAKAGIQMIEEFPAKRVNITVLSASLVFLLTGFPLSRE